MKIHWVDAQMRPWCRDAREQRNGTVSCSVSSTIVTCAVCLDAALDKEAKEGKQ